MMKCPVDVSVYDLSMHAQHSQSRMFFSSGQAQMNGGGDFCMLRYSYIVRTWPGLDRHCSADLLELSR